jgi:creatinine amidohydrolase
VRTIDKYLFNTLTWSEVNECVKAGRVVLIPVGAIEQHGGHLPLDVDNVAASSVCQQAAKQAPSLLLCMPTVQYGFNEQGLDFPGTISITENNFIGYCYDIGHSLARMGFRKVLYVNGHGGNSALLEVVARLVTARTEALAAMINWWDLAQEAIQRLAVERYRGGITHCGDAETSIYLATAPDLVKMELAKEELPAGNPGKWFWGGTSMFSAVRMMNVASRVTLGGVAGNPMAASAEKGQIYRDAAVENLIGLAEEFLVLPILPRVNHLVSPAAEQL